MRTVETKLVVTDQFAASLSQFSAMAQLAGSRTEAVNSSVRLLGQNMNNSVGGAAAMAAAGFSNLQTQASRVVEVTQRITEEEREHKKALQGTVETARRFQSTLGMAQKFTSGMKGIMASAVGKLKIAAPAMELSDNIVRMKARMELINDGSQTTKELEDNIYESAQRVRLPYLDMADMVSGLGGAAGNIFSSNDETIGFVENFGKLFTIAGAGQEEIKSAAGQMTQALSDGVLQGEEMDSIFRKAPNAIQTIADALGVDVQKLEEMAANGEITADVLKGAMLSATGDIAQKFDEMPATWDQVWTSMKSGAVKALQPALEKLNKFLNSDTGTDMIDGIMASFGLLSDIASGAVDMLTEGASFIAQNWDYVWPVIVGIGAAFAAAGVIGAASGLAAAASWIMAAWPFLLIAALIAGLILVLGQMGVTFEQAGEVIGTVFGMVYATLYNTFANLWNVIAVFIEFFANVFNDPVAAVAHLFFDLFDAILTTVENIAGAIDSVTGSNMAGAVAGFRDSMSGWVDATFGENAVKIGRMAQIDMAESAKSGGEAGAGLGAKLDGLGKELEKGGGIGGLFSGGGPEGGLSGEGAGNKAGAGGVQNVGRVGEVGKVNSAEDVSIADEDIKLLQDLSERQYVALVNLTAPSPISINQNNYGGSGGNIEDMAGQLARLLEQERNNKPTVVYG